jgi:hypothetical protein
MTTNYNYTNTLPSNLASKYNIPQSTTNQIASQYQVTQNPLAQVKEFQTTQAPHAIQNQGITKQKLPQTQQYLYGDNQILQKPENTQIYQQTNIPQTPIQNTINPYFQNMTLIPLPPVDYENPHFIKDFPIYESDPRYLSRFANKKIYTQYNVPVQDVRLLGTNQVAPISQNITTVVNKIGPEIKEGATVLNSSTTPVVNQVGTGVTGLNKATTELNQINTGINAVNNVPAGLNQLETGLTGLNNVNKELNQRGTGYTSLNKVNSGLNEIGRGLNNPITGLTNVTDNLTTLQNKITNGLNTGTNSGLNNITPNLVTLQNQITTPEALPTLQNTLSSTPNTGLNNIMNHVNQVSEMNTFLDNTR